MTFLIDSSKSTRRHDLDALRSFAMLLGVILHASFTLFCVPWPVHDARQNILMGLMFVSIHGFRMHLFFLLSVFLGSSCILVANNYGF